MKYQLAKARNSSIRNCHCFQETKSIMVIELPVIPKSNEDESSFSSFFAPDTPAPNSKPDDLEDPLGSETSLKPILAKKSRPEDLSDQFQDPLSISDVSLNPDQQIEDPLCLASPISSKPQEIIVPMTPLDIQPKPQQPLTSTPFDVQPKPKQPLTSTPANFHSNFMDFLNNKTTSPIKNQSILKPMPSLSLNDSDKTLVHPENLEKTLVPNQNFIPARNSSQPLTPENSPEKSFEISKIGHENDLNPKNSTKDGLMRKCENCLTWFTMYGNQY